MAVYFITGKLGGGKTLAAVSKAREYLVRGCAVASNLDLDLRHLVGPRSTRFYVRVPDSPTHADLLAIGCGNSSTNEARNGALILDECATWFNSRGWADKSRQDVINWLIHARKLGWDVFFIVQSVQVVDKQARLMLAEHVVYCRRMDRVSVPLISGLLSLAGSRIALPRLHLGIVKYGDQPGSLVVDRWWYRGDDLFKAYDTRQAFSAFYPHGPHTVLPPSLTVRNYAIRNWRFVMRLTRVLWRRFSRPLLAVSFLVAGLLVGAGVYRAGFLHGHPSAAAAANSAAAPSSAPSVSTASASSAASSAGLGSGASSGDAGGSSGAFRPSGAFVSGIAVDAGGRVLFAQVRDASGHDFSLQRLRSLGFVVVVAGPCRVNLLSGPGLAKPVALFTEYCAPSARPATPPRMSAASARAYRFRLLQDQNKGMVWMAKNNLENE